MPDGSDWEIEYARYLAEKESSTKSTNSAPSQMIEAEDTWEAQYAAYCAEKEAKLNAQDQEQSNSH